MAKKENERKNRLPAGKDKGHPHIIHAPVYPGLEGYGRVRLGITKYACLLSLSSGRGKDWKRLLPTWLSQAPTQF